MIRSFPKLGVPAAVLASLLACQAAEAGPIPLVLNKPYTQNFDSLAKTKEDMDVKWQDDTTISGWYSSRDTYRVSNGSNFNASLYSFGSINAVDRALGAITSNGLKEIFFGADFQNKTGAIITQLKVDYVGEQWRLGTAGAQTLAFSFQTNPFAATRTAVTQLDFAAIKTGGGGMALDGNAAGNRKAITFTIKDLAIDADDLFDFRWTLTNPATGLSHGLSVDDFVVTVVATAPEPSTLVLAGIGTIGLLGYGRLRRRRRTEFVGVASS
jgi:hypothetical protein